MASVPDARQGLDENKEPLRGQALSLYRILDLSDEKGLLCGKILADLGAEVIKLERPGGESARNIGPFYRDRPHPERSLFWLAYNSGKKSITLNLEHGEGRDLLRSLVKEADVLIETLQPGRLEAMGLGYEILAKVNPQLVLTSITPFGQSGPYRDYKGPDLVNMAMGGYMYICGDVDRPPVRVTLPQSYMMASVQAAMGTLLALRQRNMVGGGQHVDVSIQESLTSCITIEIAFWQAQRYAPQRMGVRKRRGANNARDLWPCKDGYIGWRLLGGGLGSPTMRALLAWMESEGMAGNLMGIDWDTVDMTKVSQEEMEGWENQIIAFFRRHTKAEIYEKALAGRMLMCPEYNPEELLKYDQLRDRDYWVETNHPGLGLRTTQPGEFCKMEGTPLKKGKPAPLVGEHNQAIYADLLGISPRDLVVLRERNII